MTPRDKGCSTGTVKGCFTDGSRCRWTRALPKTLSEMKIRSFPRWRMGKVKQLLRKMKKLIEIVFLGKVF